MEMIIQAPLQIVVGANFDAQLMAVCSPTPRNRPIEDGELCFFWALISVSLPDHSEHAIAQDEALQGQITSSFRSTSSGKVADATAMVASFPRLRITRVGRYRLRVDVVDMGS